MSTMQQLTLPFGHAFREERASLVTAIRRAGLKPVDETFLLYVHDVSHNDRLQKTYAELAARLGVSYSTARRSVARCVAAGLLLCTEDRYRTGGQRENAYAIDWDGVRGVCFDTHLTAGPAAQNEHPSAQNEQGPAQIEHPSVQNEQPYKEIDPLKDPLQEPPPPESRGGGGFVSDWEQVRRRLRAHGLVDTPTALAGAQRDGLSAGAAGELIDQWEAARPAWDIGALFWRLTRGTWPEREATVQQRDWAAEERRRTRELLASVPARARADPSEPSLASQYRRLRDQEGDL